ncbi:hypothetical protein VTG60DRAFT_1439 [Thermothelomyces hinnuleus]
MSPANRLFIFRKVASRHGGDETSNTTPAPDADNSVVDREPPPAYEPGTSSSASSNAPNVPNVPNAPNAPGVEAASPIAALDRLASSNLPLDNVDMCLAHLKLLFAFQWMKEDVGFTDGLWGLWDSHAGPLDPARIGRQNPGNMRRRVTGAEGESEVPIEIRMGDKNLAILSKIREKRWALFVARAVDRYRTWWQTVIRWQQSAPLTEDDMRIAGSPRYSEFPSNPDDILPWREDMLPPLDVLLVWHTHMLNPRAFLEDCMLAGLRRFWVTGMPWHLINKVIDGEFNYNVSAECVQRWTRETGLAWKNAQDPMAKTIRCPRCNTWIDIPWTTCEFPEQAQSRFGDDSYDPGNGYGDANLQFPCPSCNLIVCKELLAAAKFVQDHRALLGPICRPMPGTLLDPITGTPSRPSSPWVPPAHEFPNRLLKSGCGFIRSNIDTLIVSGTPNPSMKDVRAMIDNVMKDKNNIREIEQVPPSEWFRLPAKSRMAVRKMMSRYWENFGTFALELGAAVMRQGIFVEKMCQLDWLHSPTARDTMARLIVKYQRFMQIMAKNPGKIAVPTLDVDLAWHTHQLSPGRYYQYTVDLAGRFIDHDDKIDSTTLGEQFEWTSKVYQELYGEVYSECTCWYCESVRSSHISSVGSVLGLSRQEKIAESFHASGAASLPLEQRRLHR